MLGSRALFATLALLAVSNSAAHAASWAVGSHLGFSAIRSERPGSGSSTVFAWPTNTFTYQPALRVGLGNARHTSEFVLDSGLFALDQAGSTLSLLVLTASYQRAFTVRGWSSPFADAGAGFYREGGPNGGSTAITFGAGLGLRRVVGDQKGALRAEVRLDRLQADNFFGRPALNYMTVRLGFDLWL